MKTIEYRTDDKSKWLRGPWDDEPDKMQFMDEATSLPCLIVRNRSGVLCGYVGVKMGHPAWDKNYDEVDVRVHGGLTFGDFCQPVKDESHGVCHVVEAGENDKVYWLGFDTGHGYDYWPAFTAIEAIKDMSFMEPPSSYKDIAYVKAEIAQLAQQLAAMK